jgi:hypothetical protein
MGLSMPVQCSPTHGNCRAAGFAQIEKGHFGSLSLDGLRWGILAAWPAAIHLGNGKLQSIIDERANPEQRKAIETITHGGETEPGSLIWQVFSTTITEFLPTLYKPIDLTIDLPTRTARVVVPGVVEGQAESICNPVTKAPHQVRMTIPNGFEFTESEVVNGKFQGGRGNQTGSRRLARSFGAFPLEHPGRRAPIDFRAMTKLRYLLVYG